MDSRLVSWLSGLVRFIVRELDFVGFVIRLSCAESGIDSSTQRTLNGIESKAVRGPEERNARDTVLFVITVTLHLYGGV